MHIFLKMLIDVYVSLQCAAIPRQIIPGEVTVNCVTIKLESLISLYNLKHCARLSRVEITFPAGLICVTKSNNGKKKKSTAFVNLKSSIYLITKRRKNAFHCSACQGKKWG